jgi:hypothetical protein
MSTVRLGSTARGVTLILLSSLCVGAWAVHLLAITSMARLHQRHSSVIWAMQGVTVLTAIPCLVTIALAGWWLRDNATPGDEGSPAGRTVFLCWMALFVGIFNLLLIVLEETFATLLHGYA